MRATTTALVRDLDMEVGDLQLALASSLHAAGYLPDPDDLAEVAEEADALLELAAPAGRCRVQPSRAATTGTVFE